jgi:hypothetical protein
MKKNIALLAAIALGAISATAQEAATTTVAAPAPAATPAPAVTASESPALSVTASMSYDGKYVFRGTQLAEAIFSPAVNVSYGNVYGGLWFAVPCQDGDDYVNEMDANFGYMAQVSDLFKLDVGVTRYAYDEILDDWMNNGNSTEAYVGLNADYVLSPALYIYRDFDLSTITYEGKISHSIEVMKDLSVAIGASAGYVRPDDEDLDDYVYVNAKADLVYALADKSSASVGIRYGSCSEDYLGKHADENDAIWLGASISTGF